MMQVRHVKPLVWAIGPKSLAARAIVMGRHLFHQRQQGKYQASKGNLTVMEINRVG
jgi:hypothetical protein